MTSKTGRKLRLASLMIVGVLTTSACENSALVDGMEGFTGAVEGFTERVKSQNTMLNNSTVEATGSYTFGDVSISAAKPHVLTPAQLREAREDVRWRYIRANDANDVTERTAWAEVSKEFEEELSTLNEVVVLKIENSSYDDIDASGASVLMVAADNSRKDHAVFSSKALDVLNDKAFLLDRESNDRIEYISGKLGAVPALSTKYYGIIVPRMSKGSHTAVISNFPGSDERLNFAVVKN